ncbi:MAG: selenocysteine-specific translation elongation factor [Actinomycetota bacterium]
MAVLATAGHVDHGKSTLVQRLTGIDPDRWEEEKRRGLTIDLGFAWMTLPDGRELGIVDVPGHERFIGNMLAGVTSVASVLFVVDATEGWKPQSEEHLQILDLMGVDRCVVAMTKSDLADADQLEDRRAEIEARLDGTSLHGSPIIPVSAITGDGMDPLIAAITEMVNLETSAPTGRARMFIDRSFTIAGAGTVVTGTLAEGRLHVGEEIQVLPSGISAKIRSIQSHMTKRDPAEPVSRVAVNLSGISKHDVARGQALVSGGPWMTSRELIAIVRLTRTAQHLKARGAFTVHLGTANGPARLRFFDPGTGGELSEIAAGTDALALIRFDEPQPALPLDRIIIRDTGGRRVIAGGMILDIDPMRPPDVGVASRAHLSSRQEVAVDTCTRRGPTRIQSLLAACGLDEVPEQLVTVGDLAMTSTQLQDLDAQLGRALRAFHDSDPVAAGAPRPEMLAQLGWDASLLEAMVADDRTCAVSEGSLIRGADFRVRLPEGTEDLVEQIEAAGLRPPTPAELEASPDLLEALVRAGRLVRIGDLIFAATTVEAAGAKLREILGRGPATTSELRKALGTSRRYAIPLLEHFDRIRLTRFDGEHRSLVQ